MSLLASLRDWLTAQHLDAVLLSSRQNKQPHMGISSGSGFVFISHQSAHIWSTPVTTPMSLRVLRAIRSIYLMARRRCIHG